jgi:nicotinamidase-related amidase
MHSAFFQTGLEFLLQHLGVTDLILTGIAAEICVFFTANDAHMRAIG